MLTNKIMASWLVKGPQEIVNYIYRESSGAYYDDAEWYDYPESYTWQQHFRDYLKRTEALRKFTVEEIETIQQIENYFGDRFLPEHIP